MTWLQPTKESFPTPRLGRLAWLTRVRLAVAPVILALPLLGPAGAAAQRYGAYLEPRAVPQYDAEAYREPRAVRPYNTTIWFDPDYNEFTSGYDDVYRFGGEYYGYDVESYVDDYDPIELYDYQSGYYNYGPGDTYDTDRWYDTDEDFTTWYD